MGENLFSKRPSRWVVEDERKVIGFVTVYQWDTTLRLILLYIKPYDDGVCFHFETNTFEQTVHGHHWFIFHIIFFIRISCIVVFWDFKHPYVACSLYSSNTFFENFYWFFIKTFPEPYLSFYIVGIFDFLSENISIVENSLIR